MIVTPPSRSPFAVTVNGTGTSPALAYDADTRYYPDALTGTDLLTQGSLNGNRTILILRGPEAPTTFHFSFSAVCRSPRDRLADYRVELMPLRDTGAVGMMAVSSSGPESLGDIAPPWAVDANRQPLTTSYEVNGSTLIQRVDTSGAAFPVTVDPTYVEHWCADGYGAHAKAYEYLVGHLCPIPGMFFARHNYFPVKGYDPTIADQFGWVSVRHDGECSGPFEDSGPWWDFQIPCRAHDYCWDLIRAGFAKVTKGDCDKVFLDHMRANCEDQPKLVQPNCYAQANTYSNLVTAAPIDGANTPGYTALIAKHSSKCADVAGVADGSSVIQYGCHGGGAQEFVLRKLPSGTYDIRNQRSGGEKCVDMSARGSNHVLISWPCHGGLNQAWQIFEVSRNANAYRLFDLADSQCIDVYRSGLADLTPLITWTCLAQDNQTWYIWPAYLLD